MMLEVNPEWNIRHRPKKGLSRLESFNRYVVQENMDKKLQTINVKDAAVAKKADSRPTRIRLECRKQFVAPNIDDLVNLRCTLENNPT